MYARVHRVVPRENDVGSRGLRTAGEKVGPPWKPSPGRVRGDDSREFAGSRPEMTEGHSWAAESDVAEGHSWEGERYRRGARMGRRDGHVASVEAVSAHACSSRVPHGSAQAR